MNNKFIEFLKSQISDRSLGQIEIATGVTKSYLSKLWRGERDIPKPETLKKLSKTMKENVISKEAAMKIVSYLWKDEHFEEMIQYIQHWEDIITDHQAIQHAKKIQRREWEQQQMEQKD